MSEKPVKVLQMIASLYFGGSQSMVMNLYKNIDRTKVQFDFIIDHTDYDNYLPLIKELDGVVYTMPSFNGKNIIEVKKAWNDLFINHPEYKILHSHSRSYASIYLPIAKKYGVKTIIHSHNTSNGKGLSSFAKDVMQYPLRYQADYFFGCSRDAGRWLFGDKVANSDKFYVLNNAIDANKYRFNNVIRQEYRKQFGLENEKVFIQVGEMNNQKNHKFTIELINELYKTNKNIKLFIVGNGELRKDIENRIDDYKLNEVITILGQRSDVSSLLQMADCYLMPSNYEGLSVAAIEAQASGIKCLLSDNVSKDVKITDVVKFLPLDVETWTNTINVLNLNRTDTYQDIVNAGFDINQTSKWLADFYKEIANE